MGSRRWSCSSGNTHPSVDLEIELGDDGRFTYTRNEHSYDYGIVFDAEGRWERVGQDGVAFHVERCNSDYAEEPWRPGQVRSGTFSGEDLIVDRDTLTPRRAS